MTKEELLKELEKCKNNPDPESAHVKADAALVQYIDDPEIATAYRAVRKWYS